MKKPSFSIIELIFVIVILAIVVSVAIPKYKDSYDKTLLLKIKTDIMNIRDKIIQHKNKNILSNKTDVLENLDDIIEFDNSNKSGTWEKSSNTQYKVYFDESTFLVFKYKKDKYSFDCDEDDKYCKELTQ